MRLASGETQSLPTVTFLDRSDFRKLSPRRRRSDEFLSISGMNGGLRGEQAIRRQS
jgi:hypothetical protein